MFQKAIDALIQRLTKLERLADVHGVEVAQMRRVLDQYRRDMAARVIVQEPKR